MMTVAVRANAIAIAVSTPTATTLSGSVAVGAPVSGAAGTGNFGDVQSGALEASNVDLTAQLVNMIEAQRTFQANAQMLSTSDPITQTVLNIR